MRLTLLVEEYRFEIRWRRNWKSSIDECLYAKSEGAYDMYLFRYIESHSLVKVVSMIEIFHEK